MIVFFNEYYGNGKMNYSSEGTLRLEKQFFMISIMNADFIHVMYLRNALTCIFVFILFPKDIIMSRIVRTIFQSNLWLRDLHYEFDCIISALHDLRYLNRSFYNLKLKTFKGYFPKKSFLLDSDGYKDKYFILSGTGLRI